MLVICCGLLLGGWGESRPGGVAVGYWVSRWCWGVDEEAAGSILLLGLCQVERWRVSSVAGRAMGRHLWR